MESHDLSKRRFFEKLQAYPKQSRSALLIENHSYATILNQHSCNISQVDAGIVLEPDACLTEGYANLPGNKTSPTPALASQLAGYATVKSVPKDEHGNGKTNLKFNNASSDASLSGQSYSTSTESANSTQSAGFSALPPARTDCSPSNNFESLVSLTEPRQRKSLLLKRFGHLVSKAFTPNNAQANQTSKINEPLTVAEGDCDAKNDEKSGDFSARNSENSNDKNSLSVAAGMPKSVLLIDSSQQVVGNEQVKEADLVILPTKRVNQRLQPTTPSSPLQSPQEQKNSSFRRHHDGRLSRGKQHSRKAKQTDFSSLTSSSTDFSSSSLSTPCAKRHSERLKKADSLSEDLESLMSLSEHSTHHRKAHSKLRQNKTRSSRVEPTIGNTVKRVEIDCPSPESRVLKEQSAKTSERCAKQTTKSGNSRSLLRLLNPVALAQRSTESTPNSASTLHTRRNSSKDCYDSASNCKDDDVQQPISGFWGFSSLISNSHATEEHSKATKKGRAKKHTADVVRDSNEQNSLMYSNLEPFAAGYSLHLSSALSQEEDLNKYQSLNLYQNLLLNYARHRHRRHHHHHRHHYHRNHHSTSRHTQHSGRCVQSCAHNSSSVSFASSETSSGKPAVWGQLIKISKSDGSQVIELQRSPGKSWGFFVARGAINDVKGKLTK